MSKKLIAIDAGRSSIKSAVLQGNGSIKRNMFSSKLGIANFNFLKTMPAITFNKHDNLAKDETRDLICKIDDLCCVFRSEII